MNQETIAELVALCQAGDQDALEDLLVWAHTPVSYLCRTLLREPETARQLTQEVLRTLSEQVQTLHDPELFEKWICRITSARCMSILPQLRGMEQPMESLHIPGKNLNKRETVDVVQHFVDRLPEETRVCLILYCCGGMKTQSVCQVTGYEPEVARENLDKSLAMLQKQLDRCMERGIQFSGMTSLVDIMHAAMYQNVNPEEAEEMVGAILGRSAPAAAPAAETPEPERRGIKVLLWIVLVLLVVLNLILVGLIVKQKLTPAPEVTEPTLYTTVPTTEAAAVPEETQPETAPEETRETTPATTVPEETEATVEATETAQASAKPAATKPVAANTGAVSAPSGGQEVPKDAPATGEDGHAHRYLTTKSNINCETGGTKRYECADCDYYYTVDIAPTGSLSFIVVPGSGPNYEATCTKPGRANQICTKCNFAATVEDPSKPALGHSYSESVVAPTATEQGYTLHKCSRCGDSYKDNYVDPVPAQTEAPAASDTPQDETA